MYAKIVVCLSLDHGISDQALEVARKFKDTDGEIFAVHVYEPLRGSVSAYVSEEVVAESLQRVKDMLAERVGDATDVQTVLLQGHSGHTITEYAAKIGADCIVIGSHKPGLVDHFLGSTASRIVRHSPCSVHVLR